MRTFGLVLFAVSVAIGLLPVLVQSGVINSLPMMNLSALGYQLIDIHRAADGSMFVQVTNMIWAVAAFGQLLVISAWLAGTPRTTHLDLSRP